MPAPRQRPLLTLLFALPADLALGLSLGLYYTITYYGRALAPLPGAVALGAPFMYYVAVDERYGTVEQAWLWMAVFPVSGLLWRLAVACCPLAARLPRLSLAAVSARLWHTVWPLLVPLPLLAWIVATPSGRPSWPDFIAVCLRRQAVGSPRWLMPLLLAFALAAAALELRALWCLLPGSTGRKLLSLGLAAAVFILAVVAVGFALAAAQQRLWPGDSP